MENQHSMIPDDLSHLAAAPVKDLRLLLEHDLATEQEEALERLTAVFIDRAIIQIRQGSSQECLEEALELFAFLESPRGAALKQSLPRFFFEWHGLAKVLSVAAQKSDRGAIEAILKSHARYGRKLLEFLASQSGLVRRVEAVEYLEISESQMSHLLRDLEEAELVLRYRLEGHKEVLIELGSAGRELVDAKIAPRWVGQLIDYLQTLKSQGQIHDSEPEVARNFMENQAPSQWVADQLAGILASIGNAGSDNGAVFISQCTEESPDFASFWNAHSERRPIHRFTTSSV